jgi:hypothetical protein
MRVAACGVIIVRLIKDQLSRLFGPEIGPIEQNWPELKADV